MSPGGSLGPRAPSLRPGRAAAVAGSPWRRGIHGPGTGAPTSSGARVGVGLFELGANLVAAARSPVLHELVEAAQRAVAADHVRQAVDDALIQCRPLIAVARRVQSDARVGDQ